MKLKIISSMSFLNFFQKRCDNDLLIVWCFFLCENCKNVSFRQIIWEITLFHAILEFNSKCCYYEMGI